MNRKEALVNIATTRQYLTKTLDVEAIGRIFAEVYNEETPLDMELATKIRTRFEFCPGWDEGLRKLYYGIVDEQVYSFAGLVEDEEEEEPLNVDTNEALLAAIGILHATTWIHSDAPLEKAYDTLIDMIRTQGDPFEQGKAYGKLRLKADNEFRGNLAAAAQNGLLKAFIWSVSPQGSDFWTSIYKELGRFANKYNKEHGTDG